MISGRHIAFLSVVAITCLCSWSMPQEEETQEFYKCYDEKSETVKDIIKDLDRRVKKRYRSVDLEYSYRKLANEFTVDETGYNELFSRKKLRKCERRLKEAGILDDFYADFEDNSIALNSKGDYFTCLKNLNNPSIDTYLNNFYAIGDNMPAGIILSVLSNSEEGELQEIHLSVLKFELMLDLIERSYIN